EGNGLGLTQTEEPVILAKRPKIPIMVVPPCNNRGIPGVRAYRRFCFHAALPAGQDKMRMASINIQLPQLVRVMFHHGESNLAIPIQKERGIGAPVLRAEDDP